MVGALEDGEPVLVVLEGDLLVLNRLPHLHHLQEPPPEHSRQFNLEYFEHCYGSVIFLTDPDQTQKPKADPDPNPGGKGKR